MIPTFLVVSLLIISGGLKLSGHHPMLMHFVELKVDDYLPLFGIAEIIFALLFLFPITSKIGLLLLTAYFGGAIAIEVPFQMELGPAVPLVLIWIAAFVRSRNFYFNKTEASLV